MAKTWLSVVGLFFAFSNAWVQAQTTGSKPIPSPSVHHSSHSISQAVAEHLISWNVDGQVGQDLTEDLVRRVDAYIALDSIPNHKKILIMIAYGVGDSRIADALVRARRAGFGKVVLMMDLARALKPSFLADERFHSRFAESPYKSNSDGTLLDEAVAVQTLLQQDFKFAIGDAANGPYLISSPPIHNESIVERPPLYHLKGLVLAADGEVPGKNEIQQIILSTHNPTNAVRNNRALVLREPILVDAFLRGIKTQIDVYARGGRIKDVPEQAPTRVEYARGLDSVELRWTDGKYDINWDIAKSLERFNTGGGRVVGFYGSWFAPTYRPILESLRSVMEANTDLSPLVVSDDGFTDVTGWGITPPMAGFDVLSLSRTQMKPFADKLAARVRAYVYQRNAINLETGQTVFQLSEEGPPRDRWVHHDKTTVIVYENGAGERRAKLWTGSMNPSANYHNAEVQLVFDMGADEPLIQQVIRSIEALPEQEPGYCVPIEMGVFRNAIGRITGHTDREIDISLMGQLKAALLDRNHDSVMKLLGLMAILPSKLVERPRKEEVDQRLNKLDRFFKWYFKHVPHSHQSERFRIRRLSLLAILLDEVDLSAGRVKYLLGRMIWRPGLTPVEVDALVDKAAGFFVGPLEILERRQNRRDQLVEIAAELRSLETIRKQRGAKRPDGPRKYFVYDHDDNLMRMQTKIKLFHRVTGEVVQVSTSEWAKIRHEVGKSGRYKDFVVQPDPLSGSFSDFNNEQIIEEVQEIIANHSPESWQGWSFADFYKSRAAGYGVFVLTARRPQVETAIAAYGILDRYVEQKTGVLVPPLLPSAFIGIGGASDPSMAKALKLAEILDTIQVEVGASGEQASLGFSDDDSNNARVAIEYLQAESKRGRWPSIKIVVFKTEGVEGFPYPPISVIDPGGELRTPRSGPEKVFAPQPFAMGAVGRVSNAVAYAFDPIRRMAVSACESLFGPFFGDALK